MTPKMVEVMESRRVFTGKVFELVVEKLKYPNGVVADFARILHPGAAAIVPVADDGSVILIEQYRHALGKSIFEIPAGTRDPQESIEVCAHRELAEETGFKAEHMIPLGEIIPVPGYCNEAVTLFLATGLTPAVQNLDEDEVLEVRRLPFSEAISMAMDGRIQDAKTITALLFAARHLGWMKVGR
jgi:ADP-ribose pyrophosphatase